MPQRPERNICLADMQRFFAGKRVTHCAVCSHHNWQLENDATTLSCDGGVSKANIDVIVLVCKNCGALQFHAMSVVAQWLDCHQARI